MAAPDRELVSALYVLDAPTLRRRAAGFIDSAAREIDFPAMLDESWSDGERALIEIACTLWGRMDIADARLAPLLYKLDRDSYERVLEAIRMRRGNA